MCEFKPGDYFLRDRDQRTAALSVAKILDSERVEFRFLETESPAIGHFYYHIQQPNKIVNPGTNSRWSYIEPFEAELLLATVTVR
jgi:hypothetical protein